MIVPAWAVYVALAALAALSLALPVIGGMCMAATAFYAVFRMLAQDIDPFKDDIEFH